MTTISPEVARQVLALEMLSNEHGATTVREYLADLLWALWDEGKDFRADRPYWEHDLHKPLVEAGLIAGTFDGRGDCVNIDTAAGRQLIFAAIEQLGEVTT